MIEKKNILKAILTILVSLISGMVGSAGQRALFESKEQSGDRSVHIEIAQEGKSPVVKEGKDSDTATSVEKPVEVLPLSK